MNNDENTSTNLYAIIKKIFYISLIFNIYYIYFSILLPVAKNLRNNLAQRSELAEQQCSKLFIVPGAEAKDDGRVYNIESPANFSIHIKFSNRKNTFFYLIYARPPFLLCSNTYSTSKDLSRKSFV